ncbi:hypothetical protein PT285_09715 [Lactobacillus sp. ESL0791]|uniref:hypothetical protein n=1 Tax=Lactobacillus sp. ESL0791 TaxID=2983234 RepID=UPI0023F7A89F|nr:hypothetical protein [Lactobacillus sp. ESL0791]MDF7639676.1 hypothetical protein [Lactobacillus sp. ESL0791]
MDYELVNETVNLNPDVFKAVKTRLQKNHGQLLCLTSMPNMRNFLQANDIEGTTLIDHITGRTYDPASYRYFNEVNIPAMDYVQMQKDGSIFVDDQGIFIAREYLFPNTRRATQDIRYLNPDGSLDYVEEYVSDGKVYSHLYYSDGQLQEIEFVNMEGQPVIRYFYYDGALNFVTVENPATHEVTNRYNNLVDFYVDQISKMMRPQDTVSINYLGVDLFALRDAKSTNKYYLAEDPVDDTGKLRGNLDGILANRIPYVAEVHVTKPAYEKLKGFDVPLDKVRVSE